jgi:hypothetical protein
VGSYCTKIPGRSIDLFEVVNRCGEGVDDILRLGGSAEAVLGTIKCVVTEVVQRDAVNKCYEME